MERSFPSAATDTPSPPHYGLCAAHGTIGFDSVRDYYFKHNMIVDERRQFGTLLRKLRKRKHLTLRDLAAKSSVPFPNISAIECGRMAAGRIVAGKLAAGLGLSGRKKKNFLTFAGFTNSRDRLSKELLAYPAILANLLPRMLKEAGIGPREILATTWRDAEVIEHPAPDSMDALVYLGPKPEMEEYLQKEHGPGTFVVLYLKNGGQVLFHCKRLLF